MGNIVMEAVKCARCGVKIAASQAEPGPDGAGYCCHCIEDLSASIRALQDTREHACDL